MTFFCDTPADRYRIREMGTRKISAWDSTTVKIAAMIASTALFACEIDQTFEYQGDTVTSIVGRDQPFGLTYFDDVLPIVPVAGMTFTIPAVGAFDPWVFTSQEELTYAGVRTYRNLDYVSGGNPGTSVTIAYTLVADEGGVPAPPGSWNIGWNAFAYDPAKGPVTVTYPGANIPASGWSCANDTQDEYRIRRMGWRKINAFDAAHGVKITAMTADSASFTEEVH